MKLPRNFQSHIISATLKFLEWTAKIVPRWLTALFVEVLFPLVYMGTKDLNNICLKNLQLVYGDLKSKREYISITKKYIKSIGYAMVDLLYYIDRPEELSRMVDLHFEDNLKKTLEGGKGVIVVSAHLGNFPLMFISLVQKGYKVNVIIRSMRDKNFSKFMHQLCARWGINMIQTIPQKEFFRESLTVLKRNELLFILLDEVVSKENGVNVKFFNKDVMRATGPILFAKRTASPILPMFIVQDQNKRFKIIIEKPFVVVTKGDDQENMLENISGLTRIVESYVNQYPFQWGGWFNKRWAFGA